MLSPITATIESARFSARIYETYTNCKSDIEAVGLLLVVRLRNGTLYNS